MFLTSVAVGRPFTTMQGRLEPSDNLCPPPGFDSVIGEVTEQTGAIVRVKRRGGLSLRVISGHVDHRCCGS